MVYHYTMILFQFAIKANTAKSQFNTRAHAEDSLKHLYRLDTKEQQLSQLS